MDAPGQAAEAPSAAVQPSLGKPGGAAPTTCAAQPERSESCRSVNGQLTVLSDWGSQDDISPDGRSTAIRGLSESYSRGLKSGRRTLTRAVSLGKPVRYGVHSIQNLRPEMEDAHHAVLGVEGGSRPMSRGSATSPSQSLAPSGAATPSGCGTPPPAEAPLGSLSYFAVFDGHGGARAAEFCGEHLCGILAADRTTLRSEPVEALRRAFARLEEEWLALARAEELMDGTTAAVALLDRTRGRCIVGNVGDSEVILGTRDSSGTTSFKALTEVHHLKRSESEAVRITEAGGRVWRGRLGHPKINPQVLSLSVSRAIGDLFFKDERYTDGQASGLTAEPYIAAVEVCGKGTAEQFLLIGCDGLWDTVSYREASDFVFTQLGEGEDPQAISESLVRLARDAGSSDNITVMVVVM